MNGCDETARERGRARSLYLELSAWGVEVRVEQHPVDPSRLQVVVKGLRSLSTAHADGVRRRVRRDTAALADVLMGRYDPDLEAIRWEGGTR